MITCCDVINLNKNENGNKYKNIDEVFEADHFTSVEFELDLLSNVFSISQDEASENHLYGSGFQNI